MTQARDTSNLTPPLVTKLEDLDLPGNTLKFFQVNAAGDGVDFVDQTAASTTMDALTDTPASKSGQAGKTLIVNGAENALVYSAVGSGGVNNPFRFNVRDDFGSGGAAGDGATNDNVAFTECLAAMDASPSKYVQMYIPAGKYILTNIQFVRTCTVTKNYSFKGDGIMSTSLVWTSGPVGGFDITIVGNTGNFQAPVTEFDGFKIISETAMNTAGIKIRQLPDDPGNPRFDTMIKNMNVSAGARVLGQYWTAGIHLEDTKQVVITNCGVSNYNQETNGTYGLRLQGDCIDTQVTAFRAFGWEFGVSVDGESALNRSSEGLAMSQCHFVGNKIGVRMIPTNPQGLYQFSNCHSSSYVTNYSFGRCSFINVVACNGGTRPTNSPWARTIHTHILANLGSKSVCISDFTMNVTSIAGVTQRGIHIDDATRVTINGVTSNNDNLDTFVLLGAASSEVYVNADALWPSSATVLVSDSGTGNRVISGGTAGLPAEGEMDRLAVEALLTQDSAALVVKNNGSGALAILQTDDDLAVHFGGSTQFMNNSDIVGRAGNIPGSGAEGFRINGTGVATFATVNGVALTNSGSAGEFLNKAGLYVVPPASTFLGEARMGRNNSIASGSTISFSPALSGGTARAVLTPLGVANDLFATPLTSSSFRVNFSGGGNRDIMWIAFRED